VPEKWISEGTALVERLMPVDLTYGERTVSVSVTPVGVDVDYIEENARSDEAAERTAAIREELGDTQLILSVGRTDYTKGGIEQLASFERLLEANPELRWARCG
jgi:trehalose-6-phosphate synthase